MLLYVVVILLAARIPQVFPFLCKLGLCFSVHLTAITTIL